MQILSLIQKSETSLIFSIDFKTKIDFLFSEKRLSLSLLPQKFNKMTDPDEAYYGAIALLKKLIAIPSISRQETTATDLFEHYMLECGFQPDRKGNNIIIPASKYRSDRPTILLNSHIDTVKPVSGWTRDPFTPTEDEGRIFGLGSNDAGGALVSLFHSFCLLSKKEQPYNLLFLVSAEEEISGKNGVESVLPHLPPIALGVVGEPTGMNPATAEKGLMVLDGTVYGKSGHAARNEGINAIYKTLPIIEQLKNFQFPLESELLGPVKLTVTQISAGTQHNVIPDRCSFVVDMRTNELYPNEIAYQLLQKAINCELAPRSLRLNSSKIADTHPFVRRCRMAGLQPFGSPTLSDQALMPFETVKIGPGDSSRSHTADEFIETVEIRQAIEMYVKLLDGLDV